MKTTIDNKRYDTKKCETLGEIEHYSTSNNYSGTTYLLRASDGKLIVYCNTNGQDCFMSDYITTFAKSEYNNIDDFTINEEQEKRCAELGLVEIIL